MDDYARTLVADLSDEEKARVVAIFAGELAGGWIPSAADVAAACRLVYAARKPPP